MYSIAKCRADIVEDVEVTVSQADLLDRDRQDARARVGRLSHPRQG